METSSTNTHWPKLLSVFFPLDILVKGQVPTPVAVAAVEGDEIDQYGEYQAECIFLRSCLLWPHWACVMLNSLLLSENVGYINGQVQPEGKKKGTFISSMHKGDVKIILCKDGNNTQPCFALSP